ncbi:MAG: polysaccharide deacetylase family protein, partial [Candidatus Omnitrophica bacterium]|nr:polysaccharide deacetylase family protein [Candidatus Omnitrophota bacterium]
SFLRRHYVVPILMYHSVSPKSQNALTVSPDAFERQMRFLKTHKYNVVTLEVLVDLVSRGKKFPTRTVAITFDDGYKDNFIYAFPILKKYGIKATEFIIVNEVSRPQGDRLSWEDRIDQH